MEDDDDDDEIEYKETEKDAGSRSIVRLWSISLDTIVQCSLYTVW